MRSIEGVGGDGRVLVGDSGDSVGLGKRQDACNVDAEEKETCETSLWY